MMENLTLNQPLQNLSIDYQLKLIGAIDLWSDMHDTYAKGVTKGLKIAKEMLIETIKEMEKKYNETF